MNFFKLSITKDVNFSFPQVLPTGLGHTTSNFVNVQGTSGDSPSLFVRTSENRVEEFHCRSRPDKDNSLSEKLRK